MNNRTGKKFQRTVEDFICLHCNTKVTGDGFTNHCPACLWSRHVDISPGDRAAECRGMMKPVKLEVKTSTGLHGGRILHRCSECEHEQWNKVSNSDSDEALLALSSNSAA